ncbi:multidrug resistance-associated ABC transporter [Mycena belliarum]|uniref:Multidrug resistance-associated ABC transporter n=1 Tax=Mycena belliarum TaxID=1033014 RepID=A0AAD6UEQ2_9AGAR|nr:multidrug resistance-associated ABC transporter [Mycena belliae]
MRLSNPFRPPPAPPGFGIGKTVPRGTASYLSQLALQWLSPFLDVGFSRPLEKDDLWELPDSQSTSATTDALEASFYSRCPPQQRPGVLRAKSAQSEQAGEDAKQDTIDDSTEKPKRLWQRKPRKQFDSSLFLAIHRTFIFPIWSAGILTFIADALITTTPLLTKVLLTWLIESYTVYHATDAEKASGLLPNPGGLGHGIGLGFALFSMQEVASLMTNHSQQIMMTVGLSVRTGAIGAVFRKSMRLSARARLEHGVGQTTTIISTDATRLQSFATYGHMMWVSPIQIVVGIALLIANLGYSALVGLGVLILGFPLQAVLVQIMFSQRNEGVKITDKRVRLSTEVLQGIRLIKYYAWERFYAQQIGRLREGEIATIRNSAVARAGLFALVELVPVLASVLSFITYALSGHNLNVAIIFSSLQLFNIIRIPLIKLPLVLSVLAEALVALQRIGKFLVAEELAEPYAIDGTLDTAVKVDASFAWEVAATLEGDKTDESPQPKKGKQAKVEVLPTVAEKSAPGATEKPFELNNLHLAVPKGAFVAIVGRVGSGKSSILQALIGEMRRTSGTVQLGGSISYAPQTPWIRNASLRQNIIFGQEEDEEKFRRVLRACSLDHDLEVLPHGEETEIGEKGINLSGGQKARVSLARAAYSESDIVLLDDPLSAVDSYVGKAILDGCILTGPLANRTRVLVTHALHVLDKTDYIYVMDNGVISEEGTFETLMESGLVFSRLMEDYGKIDELEQSASGKGSKAPAADAAAEKKDQAALMQAEERNTGAVTWETYQKYLKFAGGIAWAPILLLLLTLTQAAQVANTLFLGFWTGGSIHGFRQGDYMAVYAALSFAQAIFLFLTSIAFTVMTLKASMSLFSTAMDHVFRSPSAFFDTTPMGRILSRLTKDQDTLDDELSITLMFLLTTFSSVIGTIFLVFYTFPYLGIIFAPMMVIYYVVSVYYRRSSVETKRLDSLMRSALYSSYSETLTGLATIRAYRGQSRAIVDAETGLDLENRAYFMTVTLQNWLALRLDLLGNVLLLGIALVAAGFRHTIDPAKIGVVLTYTLSITGVFSQLVALWAQNEQNLNAAERMLVYTELPGEAASTTPEDPPSLWPEHGKISFRNVKMSYREGLPQVLKDVSFDIQPGEKVGIVGRTGAGKSSLLQALFRIVELDEGDIHIDGYNTRNLGLDVLRGKLALVPQDSVMFLASLRDNLDPAGSRTDAELISMLQRAWLLPREGDAPDPVAESKFSLDSIVGDEGSNYSAGEKQLLALCRALVKNSRIIVLDEATSSVDFETDAKLQRTIRTEFAAATLLCIAHRLNTIAYYDRILVMDQGQVAEFDTVLNLFDREDSIFRSLCNEANLSRAEILHIREESISS